MADLKVDGTLIKITPVVKITDTFSKQQIIVKTADQYPQEIAFDIRAKDFERVEGLKIGEELEVSFNIRGSEYNGRHFVNLTAWKIWQVRGQNKPAEAPKAEGEKVEEKSEDLPF